MGLGKPLRTAFTAAPGHTLVSADYSQIELRLLAHMADIDTLQDAFNNGVDVHSLTASQARPHTHTARQVLCFRDKRRVPTQQ